MGEQLSQCPMHQLRENDLDVELKRVTKLKTRTAKVPRVSQKFIICKSGQIGQPMQAVKKWAENRETCRMKQKFLIEKKLAKLKF